MRSKMGLLKNKFISHNSQSMLKLTDISTSRERRSKTKLNKSDLDVSILQNNDIQVILSKFNLHF